MTTKTPQVREERCRTCSEPLKSKRQYRYCSRNCAAQAVRIYHTESERKEARRKQVLEATTRYYKRLKDQTPADEDMAALKLFWINTPHDHQVDHIVPLSKGGLNTLSNLQYLPRTQNQQKGSRLMSEWLSRL